MYSSKPSNDYSMIINGAFIYHVYYNHLFWLRVPPAAMITIESFQNCEDIALNILVAQVTKKPPIKLLYNKKSPKDSSTRYALPACNIIPRSLYQYYLYQYCLRESLTNICVQIFIMDATRKNSTKAQLFERVIRDLRVHPFTTL